MTALVPRATGTVSVGVHVRLLMVEVFAPTPWCGTLGSFAESPGMSDGYPGPYSRHWRHLAGGPATGAELVREAHHPLRGSLASEVRVTVGDRRSQPVRRRAPSRRAQARGVRDVMREGAS